MSEKLVQQLLDTITKPLHAEIEKLKTDLSRTQRCYLDIVEQRGNYVRELTELRAHLERVEKARDYLIKTVSERSRECEALKTALAEKTSAYEALLGEMEVAVDIGPLEPRYETPGDASTPIVGWNKGVSFVFGQAPPKAKKNRRKHRGIARNWHLTCTDNDCWCHSSEHHNPRED